MVVLVDRDTASAAEILTGALQDHHRATVVGTHTFGKGVFQEEQSLSNGGALDITVGEYFTPNGHNLGGGGVREGAGHRPRSEGAAAVSTLLMASRWRSKRSPPKSSDESAHHPRGGAAAGAELRPGRRPGSRGRSRSRGGRGRGQGGGAARGSGRGDKGAGSARGPAGAWGGRGSSAARVVWPPQQRESAREAIEQLMRERGLARRFEQGVERAARTARERGRGSRWAHRRGATCASWRRSRSTR